LPQENIIKTIGLLLRNAYTNFSEAGVWRTTFFTKDHLGLSGLVFLEFFLFFFRRIFN
jgi:hypothetical protein